MTDKTSEIIAERGKRYGSFAGHAQITQRIKDAMRGQDAIDIGAKTAAANWSKLDSDQIEALEMIAHKIGRIVNGDPDYADSWADIAGYARLVSDRLENDAQP